MNSRSRHPRGGPPAPIVWPVLEFLFCVSVACAVPAEAAAQSCSQFSGVFSTTVLGSTSGASVEQGSCGGSTAPEATFFYYAPKAGTYVIDTIGSEFDTILYVRNDGGAELGCNDDITPGSVAQSRLSLDLGAGQLAGIVVDGFGSASGNFVLRINGNCPQLSHNDARDLGSPLSVTVSGSTTCGNFLVGNAACGDGGSNAPDVTFLYTPPVDGIYVLSTEGSSFDTLLYVRAGTCSGAEVACNDDIEPGVDRASRVTVPLSAGHTVLVAVDGFAAASGNFTLTISGTPAPSPSPPVPSSTPTPPSTSSLTATPTRTVTRTPTRSPTRTATSTRTPTGAGRTSTPTRTNTPTATLPPTPSSTATATSTSTATWSPTSTETATPPPSDTASPIPTETPFIIIVTPSCTPSSDITSPVVRIVSPADGSSFAGGSIPLLSGSVFEDSGMLTKVSVLVQGLVTGAVTSVDLTDQLAPDTHVSGLFRFALANVALFEGANFIHLRAEDDGCPPNRGDATMYVYFTRPPAEMNLYAIAVEVTQGIQGDGLADGIQKRAVARSDAPLESIPYPGASLVDGKRTVVRGYAAVDGTTSVVSGIPAQLIVRRFDAPVAEVRLVAFDSTIDPADNISSGAGLDLARTLDRKRGNITKSWNFVLPDSVTRDGMIDELELRVNPPELSGPAECAGCNDAANSLTVANIPFWRTATLHVRPIFWTYDPPGQSAISPQPDADVQAFCGAFARMYPVRDGCGFSMGIDFLPAWSESLGTSGLIDTFGNVSLGGVQGAVCTLMAVDRDAMPPVLPLVTAYYGLVPAAAPGSPGGVGGPVDGDPHFKPCAASFESPSGVNVGIVGQEIGHGFLQETFGGFRGYWHACGGARPLPTFPTYLDPGGSAYFTGSIGQFGLDTTTLEIFPPSTTVDFMGYSYCGGSTGWVSPFTWQILFSRFKSGAAGLRQVENAVASQELITSGEVALDGVATLAPFYVLPQAAPSSDGGAGAYSLELLDAQAHVLAARQFDLTRVPDSSSGRFYETLPFAPAAARIVLKQGTTVVATRMITPHTPAILLAAPTGGETWGANEPHEIEWVAADGDGDTLSFLVQFSQDDGQTWQTLASNVREMHLAVDANILPGGNRALVRVFASDGLNTTMAQSAAPFTVARKLPLVFVTGVADDAVIEPGGALNLIANYIDRNGTAPASEDFVWRSDRLGVLGVGSRLELMADRLPPGPQQILLRVAGSVAPPITRSVAFLRAARIQELQVPCAGDCNGDRVVTVDELLTAVNIALGALFLDECFEADFNRDTAVTVDEIVTAVDVALNGCTGP